MSWPNETAGNRRNAYPIGLAAALLGGLTFLAHGSALQGHWRIDDTLVLLYIVEHPDAFGHFFSPGQWQSLSAPFFTPWLVLDYWLDYKLFGLNPLAFYAHHLIFVWLAAVLTFVLLLRHVGWFWAGVAACLFLIGSPMAVVSQQLQARHYATGLVSAILSIMFWQQARISGRRPMLALATACYLAAMLNKEIFAPLPLVLLFLDNAPWKHRFKALLPFFLTATLFVVWRWIMLGKLIGGYANRFHEAGNIAASLQALPSVFFGDGWQAAAGSMVLLLAAVLLLRQGRRRAMAALIAGFVAVSLPYLAVGVSMEVINLRFTFLPWWSACTLVALGFGGAYHGARGVPERRDMFRGASRYLAPLAVALLFSIAAGRGLKAANDHAVLASEFDAQGRFLWDLDKAASYVPFGAVSGIPQFQYATSALKMALLQAAAPVAIPFTASAGLLAGNTSIFLYDPGCRCMRKETPSASSAAMPSLPLEVAVDRPRNGLTWRFVVPAEASCYMLFIDLNASVQLPCTGELFYRMPAWLGGSFRFLARTASGQWVASPPLLFPGEGQGLKWSSDQVAVSRAAE